jgi:hypothetical protein
MQAFQPMLLNQFQFSYCGAFIYADPSSRTDQAWGTIQAIWINIATNNPSWSADNPHEAV